MNLQQRPELKMFTRAVRQMRKINTQIYNSKTKNGLSKIENRHQIAQNSMPTEASYVWQLQLLRMVEP
jgi:phosphopantetheine adenylyltransferase